MKKILIGIVIVVFLILSIFFSLIEKSISNDKKDDSMKKQDTWTKNYSNYAGRRLK